MKLIFLRFLDLFNNSVGSESKPEAPDDQGQGKNTEQKDEVKPAEANGHQGTTSAQSPRYLRSLRVTCTASALPVESPRYLCYFKLSHRSWIVQKSNSLQMSSSVTSLSPTHSNDSGNEV